MRKLLLILRAAGVVVVTSVAILAVESQTMNDAMVQLGWCAKNDSVCLFWHYGAVILVLILIVLIFGFVWIVSGFVLNLLSRYSLVAKLTGNIKLSNQFLITVENDERKQHWLGIRIQNATTGTISALRILLKRDSCTCLMFPDQRLARLKGYSDSERQFDAEGIAQWKGSILVGRAEIVYLARVEMERFVWLLNGQVPIDADDLKPIPNEENVDIAIYELELLIDAMINEHPIETQTRKLRITFIRRSNRYSTREVRGVLIKQASAPKFEIKGEEVKL